MYENWNKICRLCLKDSDTLISLFKKCNEVFFPDLIKDAIDILISKDDQFPPNICNFCISKVESVNEIRKEFRQNDIRLREILLNRLEPKEKEEYLIEHDPNLSQEESAEIKLENFAEMVNVNLVPATIPAFIDDEIKDEVKSEKAEILEGSEDSEDDDDDDMDNRTEDDDSDEDSEYNPAEKSDPSDAEEEDETEEQQENSGSPPKPKLKKVPRSNNFKCYVCSEQLHTSLQLDTHLPVHMDQIPFKCHLCIVNEVIVNNLSSLNQHMKMHEKPNKCEFCDKRFNTGSAKKFHVDQVHLDAHETIECQICNKKCANKAYMTRHMKMHNGDYQCRVCNKCFSNNTSLKRHGLIHSGEKPFKCHVCVKTFKDKSNYRTHMQIHNGDKSYDCKECPTKFTRPSQLDAHIKAYHTDDSKLRKRAPKKRPDIDYLCKINELTKEQYFECKTCGKTYSTPQRVVHHIATHNKSHQCTVCGKIFLNPSRLAEHENQHTGNRPFTCEFCGMKFSYSCTLRRHKRTHTGEKNYHCQICQRSFRYTDNLKKHMLTHTGEKPFECVICDKRFRDKRSYTKHTAKHTELSAPPVSVM